MAGSYWWSATFSWNTTSTNSGSVDFSLLVALGIWKKLSAIFLLWDFSLEYIQIQGPWTFSSWNSKETVCNFFAPGLLSEVDTGDASIFFWIEVTLSWIDFQLTTGIYRNKLWIDCIYCSENKSHSFTCSSEICYTGLAKSFRQLIGVSYDFKSSLFKD